MVLPTDASGQEYQAAALFVTYVSATPECACDTTVGKLEIVFRVVYFSCEPYYGFVSHPVYGLKEATFLLVSTETHQTKEYHNITAYPSASEGEYRAQIPIGPDDPTARVLVYVKGNSLQIDDGLRRGPPNNISSEQTDDTSDLSLVEIGTRQPAQPLSPVAQLLQGNELVLILLAVIVALLLLLAIFARRKERPTSLTLVREPHPGPSGRRRPTSSRRGS
jgi:hypothetical protein